MIINIQPGCFGGRAAAGDLICIANIVEHLRKVNSNDSIKFYMEENTIQINPHCQYMYNFLLKNTNYFSEEKGGTYLGWKNVNTWDFRDISGDLVKIPNNKEKKNKLLIFPLFDAPYNQWRNWPMPVFQNILDANKNFEGEKIICIKKWRSYIPPEINLYDYKVSTVYEENLDHILDCDTFIGGDTGTTHFAWVLDQGPKNLIYYGSSRALVHTLPFYLLQGKGKIVNYWLNMEGTTW